MNQKIPRSSRSPYQAAGFTVMVMLLCVCVIVQMLGVPATFVDLFNSDVLAKSEPVSEDHSAVSPSPEPARPGFFTVITETHSVPRLPILSIAVFHPPSL